MLSLTACSELAEEVGAAGIESYTCEDVADEAAALSEEGRASGDVVLLSVVNPTVTSDERSSYTPPSRGMKNIFVCEGEGVWDTKMPGGPGVKIYMAVDAADEVYTGYKWTGKK